VSYRLRAAGGGKRVEGGKKDDGIQKKKTEF